MWKLCNYIYLLSLQLKAKEEQLARGIVEYDRLTSYTQDYKMKSKQKVRLFRWLECVWVF